MFIITGIGAITITIGTFPTFVDAEMYGDWYFGPDYYYVTVMEDPLTVAMEG